MKNLRKKSEDPQVYVIPIKCLGRKSIQTFKKKKDWTYPYGFPDLFALLHHID